MNKKTLLGSLYLSLAASIWGGMYVVVKHVVDVVPPLEIVWIRYMIAIVALLIIGTATRQSWRIAKRDMLLILLLGLVGNTVSILTQEAGTMLSTAQMGAIITSTTPAFMVLFARIFLKERITLKKALSIVLATIGVGIIVGTGSIDPSLQLGGISLLVAALTWALMSVLVKKVPGRYSQIVVTFYSILVAIVVLTPFTVSRLPRLDVQAMVHPSIWGGLLYLGIISTACGFLLWNRGLQMLNASSGGLFFFLQPVVGTLLGWLLLGEQIGLSFWAGTAFIFTGVLLVVREK
ncbi:MULTISPECIES: EamA family transporter [unclassified Paenibacillus]|uniref:DMT family transporter n=1 Tax=unclassified Paenibacillus TaxID=185978 RepID=UPI0024060BA8|nr:MULTISPECIES: EamA family transporter [unclassified Paenibacillus]MDF9845084.1 drug/metabolite transporter (DMT)-like permease [Paenibacillus sp. PastF-2]MDF9851685.1 drug/metabolite transporter (DMT)-like permease [Paenibacillus sp. PastM-2]MDF9858269.1 drug/metabolite transporter (DMT)-like permease [Paenibacillus sp. PastF-1]MDH6483533.1 drug/metabolite transporter (DMT)-like permease [Paenibacillus sp. PastH-2]MDH6510943.1 drug/metabolite transporter (DMT)-like permease [Paenibacillus s